MDAFERAFSIYEQVADITYVRVYDRADADIKVITYEGTPGVGASLLGRMSPPGENDAGQMEINTGDVRWMEEGVSQGGFYFPTLLHELGHGHGMAHPHDNGDRSSVMRGAERSEGSGRGRHRRPVRRLRTEPTGYTGISARLSIGRVLNDGSGAVDILSGVENVTGSAFADTLFGDVSANVLPGGGGRDTLMGNAGANVLGGDLDEANTVYGGLGDDRFLVGPVDTAPALRRHFDLSPCGCAETPICSVQPLPRETRHVRRRPRL